MSKQETSLSQQNPTDKDPQVYRVTKESGNWRFNRRSFVSAVLALGAGAAAAGGRNSQGPAAVSAGTVKLLPDPSDETLLSLVPGQEFVKEFRLQNNGSEPWGEGGKLRLKASGAVKGPKSVEIPDAAPGEIVSVRVPLTAPLASGTYQTEWQVDVSAEGDYLVFMPLVIQQQPQAPTATVTPTATVGPSPSPTRTIKGTPVSSVPFESIHNPDDFTSVYYVIINPDVNALGTRVHFSRISLDDNDWLMVMDQPGYRRQEWEDGFEDSDVWSVTVGGRILRLWLVLYGSGSWGFRMDQVQSTAAPTPTSSCSCTCTSDGGHYWYPT